MNEKRISDRCQKLNAYVNDLKNKEIERLNAVKNNTSDIVMMFEYNKDYFKHYLKGEKFRDQYSSLISCLENKSGINKGTYNAKALNRILFFNGIFSCGYLFKILIISAIIICISFIYLFYYFLYSVNSLSFYNFSIIFCLVFFILFFILYAILINSYIRFFKIKEPHLWN